MTDRTESAGMIEDGEGASRRGPAARAGRAVDAVLKPVLRRLPRGLFARSLLIVVLPILVLQTIMTFVFMDRHWELVTRRLSDAVARDVGMITELMLDAETAQARNAVIRTAARRLEILVDLAPGETLPPAVEAGRLDILQINLTEAIARKVAKPIRIDATGAGKFIEVRVLLPGGVMRAVVRRSHAYASNSHIFLVWMGVASLVLITLSVLFLRNQIRPIVALSHAAERFGRGQEAPRLRPRGAREVRRAAVAFQQMRTRMQRFVDQRTVMLAGVSHDLRTVITRFRLQLALMDETPETDALNRDIDEMEAMLAGYLSFVKGGSGEAAETLDVEALLRDAVKDAAGDAPVEVTYRGARDADLRPQSMRRLLVNLIGNARRYGRRIAVSGLRDEASLTLTVEDDGPGIPPEMREEALRPFGRLDGARGLGVKGGQVGLGLAVAHDVARAHGGALVLDDSSLGGLKVTVTLPV